MAQRHHKVGLDTSCVIPLLCDWHEFHKPTLETVAAVRRNGLVICTHVVLECFAVLTRLPAPYRMPPRQAQRLLAANFSETVDVCGVLDTDLWTALDRAAERQTGGGRIYDTVIAQAAARAGASVLLTWNVKDFLAVAPHGLEIRAP
jgi:predicted nucleic acid-binding protein